MNLVFKEYIQFLESKGLKNKLKEGYYWYDKSIIKAYDKEGNVHKILRVQIDDNLDITFKKYKDESFDIESWEETLNRNKSNILKLEEESVYLIKQSTIKYKDLIPKILTSGGKDSSVTEKLVKLVFPNAVCIFNNTTLDCADTYLHINSKLNTRIINPKEGFYQWRERNNFVPTRFSRACCTIFKEGAMVDELDKNTKLLLFMGMRNQESNTRSSYGDEWRNEKWGDRCWQGILPIRKWTEEEIWLYILYRKIEINSKYKKGYARVGCAIACPYYTKSTWALDQYWYPQMYKRWHDILEEDFISNKKASIMNCTLKEYYTNWNGGVVRDEPTEEIIVEFAEQQGLDLEVARRYFDKRCSCCNKKLKALDIALSMKFYGRKIENFKCIKDISKDLGVPVKELKLRAKEFKEGGCDLF